MIAVLGAGPAGCAAAITLARAGRAVVLLERSPAAREVVCGEFFGPDAAAALARLGLDPAGLGAVLLARLRVAHGARVAEAPLPFPAWGLSRLALDGTLQALAGPVLRRGVTVLAAEPAGSGWRIRTTAGEILARQVVLATGKHGLRGHPRRAGGAVGLKLHLEGVVAGDAVTLLPFAGGYAGLQPTPGGGANLCAAVGAVPADLLAAVAAGSALGARLLGGARPAWAKPLAVGGVPYGWRAAPGPAGLYRVGDQAAVIPSFTGEGVALALHSGLAAAEAILAGQDAAGFHAAWARRSAGPMRWAAAGAFLLRHAPGLFAAAAGVAPLAGLVAGRTRVAVSGRGLFPPAVIAR